MRHLLKDVGPRGLYFNLKSLLFLSNQGSQLAPQMLKHIIRPHRTRMCGSWAATGFSLVWCIHKLQTCDLHANSFQHKRYSGGLVQAYMFWSCLVLLLLCSFLLLLLLLLLLLKTLFLSSCKSRTKVASGLKLGTLMGHVTRI